MTLTISPSNTTFSPRIRNKPLHASAKTSWWYIRSTVSSRTRFAGESGKLFNTSYTSILQMCRDAHQTDRMSAIRLAIFYRLEARRASSLKRARAKGVGMGEGQTGQKTRVCGSGCASRTRTWDGRTVDAVHERPGGGKGDEGVHFAGGHPCGRRWRFVLSVFPERLENCSSRSTGLKHGTDVNQPLPKLYNGAGPLS